MNRYERILDGIQERADALKIRTPAPGCPDCAANRLHSPENLKAFHPWAGHGLNGRVGCACKDPACVYAGGAPV